MFHKCLMAPLLTLGLIACMAGGLPAANIETAPASARPSGYGYTYRVWIYRYNRYTGKSWWEVYSQANGVDQAQRVVNTLESLGYEAYWDRVSK